MARMTKGAAVIALALAWTTTPASGVTLFSEDFEGLTLGPYTSPSETPSGTGSDFTSTPPAGWVQDNTTTPAGGVPEFFGWTFHDVDSWDGTSGQRRGEFTLANGSTVMLADGDEYSDAAGFSIGANSINVFITTPTIDVSSVIGDVTLSFFSSFRGEADQAGIVDVIFDGDVGSATEVFRRDTGSFVDPDSLNEDVEILFGTGGASEIQVRFGYVDADNNWWWAVDNVAVSGEVPEPTATLMLGAGLAGLLVVGRRRKAHSEG